MKVSWRDKTIALFVVLLISTAMGCAALTITFAGRRDIVNSQRANCHRGIADRLDSIDVRSTQAWSAQVIADDPFQSARTREARGSEARVLRRSVRRLTVHVDPGHGGQLVCDEAFPAARWLP